jgi:hypothetical protein
MTQYLLSVHSSEGDSPDLGGYASAEEMQEAFERTAKFNEEVQAAGVWVFAGGLQPPETSTVVSTAGGTTTTTDGPFAESKEQLGGFWIIDVPDLDAALEWAAKGSAACMAAVEVRPFQGE